MTKYPYTKKCIGCGQLFAVTKYWEHKRKLYHSQRCAFDHRQRIAFDYDKDAFVRYYNLGVTLPGICKKFFICETTFWKIVKILHGQGLIAERRKVKPWSYTGKKTDEW